MVDTLNTHQEPKPESQEYIDNMVAKAEGLDNTQEERPQWLPSKFNSPEDMANAYAELEREFHGQGDSNDVEDMDTGEVQEYLSEQGVDFEAMATEFWNDGGLSDEAYDTLEEIGIPSDIVDSYIDGQMAIMEGTRQTAFNAVGGEQVYTEMVEWAQNNLPEQDIDAFNEQIDSGDMNQAMFAIQGLHARYRSETGTEPSLVAGENSDVSVGAFQSLAELTTAMSDPRYEKDPAYRDAVAGKLARSAVL